MDLDLTQVSAFLVLVEERHVGRAANRLHLTTSAVSKRVHGLERQLGVALLERDPAAGLALTGAGRRFVDPAAVALQQATYAARAARASGADHVVRLGFPAGCGCVLKRFDLPGAIRLMRAEQPRARLVTVPVPFPEMNRVLPEHLVDVLISASPMHWPGTVSERLPVTETRFALVPGRHPLAGAPTVTADELAGLPLMYNIHAPPEWTEPFWLADVRPRRDACLVPDESEHALAVLRQLLATDAVLVGLGTSAPPPPAQLGIVRMPVEGLAEVHLHAVYRADDARAVLVPLLAALGTRSQGTGDQGSADPGTGDPGTGDPGTGDRGTGDRGRPLGTA
jgi:DNA-binding transcriptional LysR family regulator